MHPFPGRYPKRCAESDSDATWKEKTSFVLTFHPRLKSVALFDATSRIQEVRGIYGEREPRSIDERRGANGLGEDIGNWKRVMHKRGWEETLTPGFRTVSKRCIIYNLAESRLAPNVQREKAAALFWPGLAWPEKPGRTMPRECARRRQWTRRMRSILSPVTATCIRERDTRSLSNSTESEYQESWKSRGKYLSSPVKYRGRGIG